MMKTPSAEEEYERHLYYEQQYDQMVNDVCEAIEWLMNVGAFPGNIRPDDECIELTK
jgi:hypothetical protein